MYLIQTYHRDPFNPLVQISLGEIVQCPPLGFPKFTLEEVKDADKLEHWGSSFNDEGDDFNEFRVIKNNQIILKKRVDGY